MPFKNIHKQKEGGYYFIGNNDVAEFYRLPQKYELYFIVHLRSYVCA